MGDFGPALLSALAGQSASPGVGAVPPEAGYVNPGMKMFGITPDMLAGPGGVAGPMRGGISETGAIPGNVAGGMGPEAETVVRGFKPKKISFWGALGDQLLKHWGNQPVFSKKIESRNMRRAMEGFTQDPVEAIRRIGQIPGHEEDAWKLLNEYQDNKRANETAQSMIQTRREKIINSASRLFGPQSLAPDGSNYSTIRGLFMNIMERNGINDVYLPEEYNPDVINAQIAGDWTLNQQDMARYRPREQARKEANTASQINRRDAQTRQGDRRLDQADTRIQDARNKPTAKGKAQPRVVMTPGGNQLIIHPSGLAVRMIKPDGTSVDLIKFGKGWKIRPPKATK